MSVAIVGIAEHPLEDGRVPGDATELSIQARVAREALADAGLTFADVDGLLSTGAWADPGPGRYPTITLAEYLGLRVRFSDSHNIGGASFVAHVAHAAMAIEAGSCDVALITYGSLQRSRRSRSLAGRPPELTMQYETPWGMPSPVGGYALAAQRYLYERGATVEDLARVAVVASQWANLSPTATKRDLLTVEDVLASPLVSDPLRVLDCCLVTDGAGAIVLTSAARARDLPGDAVTVAGFAEGHSHLTMTSMPSLTETAAAQTGPRAMAMAGVDVDDLDLLQIYDSFTITTLLTLESLGLCAAGEAPELLRAGVMSPGGSLPLNTNGGGLRHSHPGMNGLFLVIEAVRQLRGAALGAQVPDARTALVSATGGALASSATCVLVRS